MAQFAMVEELAYLIKDNLPCKHLILSMEEALVNFLQEEISVDGVLELEPMNAYNRLLLHRLADIFGFSHESVGEGDDRRLILERCPETSIPSILVSDILWQYDEFEMPVTPHQLLRRKEATPAPKAKPVSKQNTLEEREASYMAARERIFSMNGSDTNEPINPPKPRNVPVVARRMIAHALGKRIDSPNQAKLEKLSICDNDHEKKTNGSSQSERKANKKPTNNLKEEHLGAAKRMFANALGRHSPKK